MFKVNVKEQFKKTRNKLLFGALLILISLLLLYSWSPSTFIKLVYYFQYSENAIFPLISLILFIYGFKKKHYYDYFVLLNDNTISVNRYTKVNILKNKLLVINLETIKYVFYPKFDKRSYLVLKNKSYIPLLNEVEDYDLLISSLERKKIPVIERAQNFSESLIVIKMNIRKYAFVIILLLFYLIYRFVEINNNPYYYNGTLHTEDFFRIEEPITDEDSIRIEEHFAEEDYLESSSFKYYELSNYEFENENYDLALEFITKAIDLEPDDFSYYSSRAYIYEVMESYENAIEDHTKSIELMPELSYLYESRGYCYRDMGEYDNAMSDFNRAIELDPLNSWAYLCIAKTYEYMEDFDTAIDYYNKGIEMDSTYDYYYTERAHCYIKMGNLQKALQDASTGIEFNPSESYNYTVRGSIFEDMESWILAVYDYTSAIELGDNSSWVYERRGTAYNELGETKKAEKDFKKAKEIADMFEN